MVEELLRPQMPIDARVEIDSVEWLFEPDWPGPRCVAQCEAGRIRLTDATGVPVDDAATALALASAVLGDSATLDGVRTDRGSMDDDGTVRPAFIAIDLLEIDGTPLLDVPFQERRRLLESTLRESAAVRIGPVVKQPLSRWFTAWREAGFTHYLARHQNARYHPGQHSDDWLRVPIVDAAAAPGLVQRVIGPRVGRSKRIRD